MKVTSVEVQKKNPKRFNIFLEGQFCFGADEDLVVSFRLLPGKEISPTDLEKILYEAEVGKLMERVYRLLNIRQRSEREVRDYLRKLSFQRKIKGEEEISGLIVEQLIERLRAKSLINDEEFAASWIDARRISKKKGDKAIKMELLQKGIDSRVIDRILNESQVDQEKLAKDALEKKLRIWKNLPTEEFKKKATDFLLRRGFDYAVVKKVLERAS